LYLRPGVLDDPRLECVEAAKVTTKRKMREIWKIWGDGEEERERL